ncbi:hypothetical protein MRB53_012473 [Persea americana]|uniref:Uncharacterized protein n=1 Tax=Persea americana TaxID=3435 RepID=A0ACC2LXU6_PERAE|nr:hypothetical protein MRB53_012473 [Persea americana]
MDCRENEMPSELAHTAQLFLDFMTRITKLEELVAVSGRLLAGFHQELAKVLLDELECLMEDGIGVMRAENESSLQFLDKLSAFDLVHHATCFEKERIIMSLDRNTSSGELESYCLMWDLRPFINEVVMHQAWRYIP